MSIFDAKQGLNEPIPRLSFSRIVLIEDCGCENPASVKRAACTPGTGNDVGLGFGPDCHFYDSGVTLSITTGSVPDNGSTLLVLGCGLLALAGFRRFGRRSGAA